MALLQVSVYAQSVKRNLEFSVLFPEHLEPEALRSARVLMLLHGWAGNHFDWLLGSDLALQAQQRGLVVVLPSGENHFYLDDLEMEELFSQWIGEELPRLISKMFDIALVRERWFLGGYSMGGYGALRNALAFPHRFGGAIALSSALITTDIAGLKPGEKTPYAGYGYYRRVFGDLTTLVGSDRDTEALVGALVAAGGPFPRLYLACGTSDFLLEPNQHFHACLDRHGIHHHWAEVPGGHDFAFWNAQLGPALDWLGLGGKP